MNVTILGNGKMARSIGIRLVSAGNQVTVLGRDASKAAELAKELATFSKKGGSATSSHLESSIPDEIVISTINYPAVKDVLAKNSTQFAGKMIVDVLNALTQAMDDVGTPPGTSAAEEIAKSAPKGSKIFKAFNTNFAGALAQGSVGGQPIDVFLAGDDDQAKAVLSGLINGAGMRTVDAGPLKRARQLEGMAMLLIAMQGKLEKPWMNAFKIIA